MRRPALILLAAAAVLAPAAAQAASHNRDVFIREQDLNGDGKVSKEEFVEGRAKEFACMDADRNGVLSEAEYVEDYRPRLEASLQRLPEDKREAERARQMKQAFSRFKVLDSDKSGAITKAEFDYTGWLMFTHHETNEDGFVSAEDQPRKEGGA